MNKSRVFRIVSALTIVGIVASQIPSRSSVSLAADGYPESNGLLQSSLTNVLVGGFVVGGLYSVIKPGTCGGGVFGGGGGGGGLLGGNKPIFDLTKSNDDFTDIASIINNAGEIEMYRTKELTVFWPTNDALKNDVGEGEVLRLQQAGNKQPAIEFLNRITVEGKYSLSTLTTMAKSGGSLKTISGDTIELKITNGKLTANGVEMLGAEYPTSNGWVLAAKGVVVKEQS
ncbi:fasciclin domain-containing protein [Armatimonas sp.]|uniref:fasciclin domain-containing protein n=1 Tax=Armatimonas sp. TaxID=1872638 RepID=UPI00286B8F17|nr:fasciclin domain-containing protein [Armatimonas sp.]